MKKIRTRDTRLTLRRETLQRLDDDQLRAAGGVDWFTDDCLLMPSHAPCSNPCTFSCLPAY